MSEGSSCSGWDEGRGSDGSDGFGRGGREDQAVVVATTDWRGVSGDVGANALEAAVLDIILNGVLAAVTS